MKPDPSMMCNGMLAGLVAITAPMRLRQHDWGRPSSALIAGVLVVESVFFFDKASASTTWSVPSRSTASTACGA